MIENPFQNKIEISPEEYDELALRFTGAETLEEARRALEIGPEAWWKEQKEKDENNL